MECETSDTAQSQIILLVTLTVEAFVIKENTNSTKHNNWKWYLIDGRNVMLIYLCTKEKQHGEAHNVC